jgi:hypothetical protein
MSRTYADLERHLAQVAEYHAKDPSVSPYAYVEVGKYKPYRYPVVAAAKRRGHVVECVCKNVYYVYPLKKENP